MEQISDLEKIVLFKFDPVTYTAVVSLSDDLKENLPPGDYTFTCKQEENIYTAGADADCIVLVKLHRIYNPNETNSTDDGRYSIGFMNLFEVYYANFDERIVYQIDSSCQPTCFLTNNELDRASGFNINRGQRIYYVESAINAGREWVTSHGNMIFRLTPGIYNVSFELLPGLVGYLRSDADVTLQVNYEASSDSNNYLFRLKYLNEIWTLSCQGPSADNITREWTKEQ